MSYALAHFGLVHIGHRPTFVSIEPCHGCQLSCLQCPIGMAKEHQVTMLTLNHFRHILKELCAYTHTLMLFFQGEPTLNKDLPEMVRLAHEAGLYTIVSTNAQGINELLAEQLIKAGLSRIIVSIDGLSETSYSQYRQGGSLHKALQGLLFLRKAKETWCARTCIELQVLKLRSNEMEWAMFKRSYKQMGADRLTLKTAQFYNFEQGNPLMPSDPKHCRYVKGEDGIYRIRPHQNKICRRLWMGCVIDVEGNVRPCCYDKSGQYIMGNIYSQPLQQIWKGAKFNSFRQLVLQQRDKIDICTNCIE